MARFPRIAGFLFVSLLLVGVLGAAVAEGRGGSGGIGTSTGDDPAATTTGGDGVFPIRGPHTYGDGLGAGRGHQGQDLLAKCGKPVVAAQPGRVRVVDYQAGGAGNYVVVKTAGFDEVYMHLLRKPSVSRGERVDAGDQLGVVGSTGSSTTCHLHFEMWTKPGWYRGGGVTDPTPSLKRWDRTS